MDIAIHVLTNDDNDAPKLHPDKGKVDYVTSRITYTYANLDRLERMNVLSALFTYSWHHAAVNSPMHK